MPWLKYFKQNSKLSKGLIKHYFFFPDVEYNPSHNEKSWISIHVTHYNRNQFEQDYL